MKKAPEPINTNPFVRTFNGLEQLFKYNQLWTIILIVLGVGSVGSRFATDNQPAKTTTAADSSPEMTVAFAITLGLFILLIIFIGLVVMSYTNGIAAYIAWKTTKREKVGLIEAFRVVTQRFWTIMAVHAWTMVKVVGGSLLLLVPGIRAALRYQMALFPVFDENLTARPAMQRIKSLTRGHLAEIMGITSVGTVIPVLGSVLTMGGEAIIYPQLKQLERSGGDKPKVHWLNYLMGLVLVAVVIAVIAWAISTQVK